MPETTHSCGPANPRSTTSCAAKPTGKEKSQLGAPVAGVAPPSARSAVVPPVLAPLARPRG
eukprot:1353241-Alexandrium_andersonii.AAC.1